MQRISIQHFSFWLVLASCLMHVFCCGLPLLMSVMSLAAVAGMTSSELHSGWFGQYEMAIYAASGVMLLVTGLVQYIASRINCRKDGDCHHEPCEPKKNYARWVFFGAVALYGANSLLLFLTH